MCIRDREWFGTDFETQPAVTTRLIGDLDVKLVMFVHSMQHKFRTRKQYASMEDIVHDFVKAVKEDGGTLKECPWELPQDRPAASGKTAASAQ